MSAVIAIAHWDERPVEPGVLYAANASVAHRCPDGAWVWASGPVGMAQADLATLPEDRPGEPLVRWGLRIVADCRIDNRDDLRAALPSAGLSAADPDAAYILAAYRAWGADCAARLLGDFAFVIVDGAQLFAARDLSGARRLFVYSDRRRLLIASEPTQILQDPTVPLVVDEDQIAELLTPTFLWTSGWDLGLFRNLHALPAATSLSAEAGRVSLRRFWHWGDMQPVALSETELLETYWATLREAVRCRLRARNGRVGLELSGGLDSSAIAAAAAELASEPSAPELHTLSLIFERLADPAERSRIEQLIGHLGLPAHRLTADASYSPAYLGANWAPQSLLGPAELSLDEAGDSLDQLAASHGLRVVLTGMMGDSLNEGAPDLTIALLRQGRSAEAMRRIGSDVAQSPRSALKSLIYTTAPGLLPQPLMRLALLAAAWRHGPGTHIPDFVTAGERLSRLDWSLRARRASRAEARCPLVRAALDELHPPMLGVTVPSAEPIERRHPFLDRRMIELALRMPQDQKWNASPDAGGAAERWHHRRALRGRLPEAVVEQRESMDFGQALRSGHNPQAVRAWLGLDRVQIVERGYVELDGLLAAIEAPGRDYRYLSGLLALEAWLRGISPGGALRRLAPPRRALPTEAQAHTTLAVLRGGGGRGERIAERRTRAFASAGSG